MSKRLFSECMLYVVLFMISVDTFAQQGTYYRIERTNPKYELGDWISYPMTRWIRSMVQDPEYIYFASTGGIGRYNYFYHRWESPWTFSNGLADNDVYIVAHDMDTNYLWCTTAVSLSCYFPTYQRWENYYFDDIGILQSETVIAIGFDNTNVWLKLSSAEFLKGSKYGGISFFSDDEAQNNADIRWFDNQSRGADKLPLFLMSDGYFYDTDGYIQDINLNRYHISSWLLDKWGKYWVGTLGLGLAKAEVRIERLELMNFGLFVNNVSALALDKGKNIMWIGSMGEYAGEHGITEWNMNANQWSYYQSKFITDLRNDQVTSIVVDNNSVWLSTEYGLAWYHPEHDEWHTFDVFQHLADNYVYDVAVDDEYVWVATADGLSKIVKATLESDSLKVERIKRDALRTIKIFNVDVMGNLVWLGTEFGVYVYDCNDDSGGFQAESGGPMNEEVYAVSCFGNEVWFGTAHGVEVFDVERKSWLGGPQRRMHEDEGVNYIQAHKEAVWVGTDQGVLKFDRERNLWVKFTMEDGLPDNFVTSIVVDGDYVWFGTPVGLTRFYWNNPQRID